jgi:hypothetical protein
MMVFTVDLDDRVTFFVVDYVARYLILVVAESLSSRQRSILFFPNS